MLIKQELDIIIDSFLRDIKELFGNSLRDVILYGSYARGDFDVDSDIDVMILLDMEETQFHKYRTFVSRIADKADWDYDTLLSPILVNHSEFERNKSFAPFYSNVSREGVRLIA
ncbi:MAG: nucleotidyltransferase domain-containing protein [Oscillospiraceae bacterium]|nr:nucleotidyltransferase domain-containing protein [Oscillospiraceae bacterium]